MESRVNRRIPYINCGEIRDEEDNKCRRISYRASKLVSVSNKKAES